jgi:transposase
MPSILPAWRDGSGGRPPHFASRRPRHTLKGRRDAAAVEASREHPADLKTRAAAGAIDLVFLDEAEALTPPYLARCRARRGSNLRIQAPGQAKKQAMLGAFDPVRRRLLVHTSPSKRSTDFVALLDHLGAAYGTAERTPPLVAVLDNGPIHRSKLTTKALAARTWLTLEWLPKYAPELNDIERCWRDLKQHQLANRTFADADALAHAIPDPVARLNHERQPKSSPIPHAPCLAAKSPVTGECRLESLSIWGMSGKMNQSIIHRDARPSSVGIAPSVQRNRPL